MAYGDYGARVYINGGEEIGCEDTRIYYKSDKSSMEQKWAYAVANMKSEVDRAWFNTIHHGIMGSGTIRVMCHKTGLPYVYELIDGEIKEVDYMSFDKFKGKEIDTADNYCISFEYKGHRFLFTGGKPCEAEMTDDDGTEWLCEYDYGYNC